MLCRGFLARLQASVECQSVGNGPWETPARGYPAPRTREIPVETREPIVLIGVLLTELETSIETFLFNHNTAFL